MHVCPSPDSYLKTFSFVLYNSSQFFLIAGRGEAQSLGPQPAVTPPPLPGKAIMLFFSSFAQNFVSFPWGTSGQGPNISNTP